MIDKTLDFLDPYLVEIIWTAIVLPILDRFRWIARTKESRDALHRALKTGVDRVTDALVLLILEAISQHRLIKSSVSFNYGLAYTYILGSAFWNFVGAGVFGGGTLNAPLANYYEHGTFLTLAVHHYLQRAGETHHAHMFGLHHRRHGVELALAEESVATVLVDGEVAHAKRREVLEEVCTLTRVYTIIFQSYLHNYTCCRYVGPLHGYAEP